MDIDIKLMFSIYIILSSLANTKPLFNSTYFNCISSSHIVMHYDIRHVKLNISHDFFVARHPFRCYFLMLGIIGFAFIAIFYHTRQYLFSGGTCFVCINNAQIIDSLPSGSLGCFPTIHDCIQVLVCYMIFFNWSMQNVACMRPLIISSFVQIMDCRMLRAKFSCVPVLSLL